MHVGEETEPPRKTRSSSRWRSAGIVPVMVWTCGVPQGPCVGGLLSSAAVVRARLWRRRITRALTSPWPLEESQLRDTGRWRKPEEVESSWWKKALDTFCPGPFSLFGSWLP